MTDPVLKRIWEAREAISQRCGFDARRLVCFYQSRQKAAASVATGVCGELSTENAVSCAGSPGAEADKHEAK